MPRNKKFKTKQNRSQNNLVVSINTTKSVEREILETLSYRTVFNYPLSFYQLLNFLLTRKKIDIPTVSKALENLIKMHKVSVKDGKFFYLYKTVTVDWEARKKNSSFLIKKVKKIAGILGRIPWIQFIGVTGSVAAFNADLDSDLDILVVTKNNRVWLTRGFLFLILKILGELRTDTDPKQKICPNILIDEGYLAWPKNKRNLYVAHEVVMLYPVLDKNNTYFRFLKENAWVRGYFGNFGDLDYKITSIIASKNWLLNRLEQIAMFFQVKYMSGKLTTEVAKPHLIHFNRTDNTPRILETFVESKKRVLG